ncbi:atrial natriuretic peptide receptor 1 isoform X1 [Tachysurus ichikawai]
MSFRFTPIVPSTDSRSTMTLNRTKRFSKMSERVIFRRGVTGLLEMDEKGNREIDFALWDMTDTDSGVYQIVSVYNSSLKQMIPEPGMKVHWLKGVPPPDIPVCGFKNDNPSCLARTVTMLQMILIVVCFIFIIIVTVTVFVYRSVKHMSEKQVCVGENRPVFRKSTQSDF